MKRTTRLVLLLGVLAALLCVSAMAEDDSVTAAGFYDIGTAPAGVTVTPEASTGEVDKVTADVDGESSSYETFYANSDKLSVTLGDAADGEYLVLLVTGSSLPTAENTICYINQTQPEDGTVSFDVYPNLEGVSGEMTLYITSNAQDFTMKTVTLNYAPEGEYDLQLYVPGDVDDDGEFTATDALYTLQMAVGIGTWDSKQRLAANADGDNDITATDSLWILQRAVGLRGTDWSLVS